MYNIENNLDFYKLLHTDSNPISSTNICLISREELDNTKTTLACGHAFNYIHIYKEIINQKQNVKLRRRLKNYQIECPYCRTIQDRVLPFLSISGTKRIKYVNSPYCLEYFSSTCKHISKKNVVCNKPCHEIGFCNRHLHLKQKAELNNSYISGTIDIEDYSKLTVVTLKKLIKQKKIKNYSKLKKKELIKLLTEST